VIADPVARALTIAIERERREAERQSKEDARAGEIGSLRHLIHELQQRFATTQVRSTM